MEDTGGAFYAKNDYDYLFKFVLVGDSYVGKTSLLLRFVDNSFSDSLVLPIGGDFKLRTIELDGKTIKLQIYDYEPSKYRHNSSTYRIQPHAVFILFDVTDKLSFFHTKEWLAEIDRYQLASENVNKMLVATKCDLTEKRVVEYYDAKEFADSLNLPYLETSAKSAQNVEECFIQMTRAVKERMAPPRTESAQADKIDLSKGVKKKKKDCCIV